MTRTAATERQIAYATRLATEADMPGDQRTAMLGIIPAMSKTAISALIDGLRTLPKIPRQAEPVKAEISEEGIYLLGDAVYKVQRSKTSGNLYAMALASDGRFAYDRGAIFTLRREGAAPATLEDAIAYGLRTGRCCCCGHDLTHPDSIATGIGPVCAKRRYGATPRQLRDRAKAARQALAA
jgi:hypothetical protein